MLLRAVGTGGLDRHVHGLCSWVGQRHLYSLLVLLSESDTGSGATPLREWAQVGAVLPVKQWPWGSGQRAR